MRRRVLSALAVGACCGVLLGSVPLAGAAPVKSKQSGPPVSGAWRTFKSPYFDYNLKGSMTVTAHHRYVSHLQGKIVPTEQSGDCGTGHLVVPGKFRLRPYTDKVGKTKVRDYRISKGLQRSATVIVDGATLPAYLSIEIVGARGGAYSKAGLTTQGQIGYSGPDGQGLCTILFGLKKT
jgi:hypothetical protein